jgi:hypothetical protein
VSKFHLLQLFVFTLSLALATALPAHAASIHFVGTVNGVVEDVSIDYFFGLNVGTITLTNNVANPLDVKEVVTGVSITTSGNLNAALLSTSTTLINIACDGSYTPAGTNPQSSDWNQTGPGNYISAIGKSGPDQGLLGKPGVLNRFSNGNDSITCNKPHNPFAEEIITFIFMFNGATENTTVTGGELAFGTDQTKATFVGDTPQPVPEASTMFTLAGGLVALGLWKFPRRQQ